MFLAPLGNFQKLPYRSSLGDLLACPLPPLPGNRRHLPWRLLEFVPWNWLNTDLLGSEITFTSGKTS